jgi:hypothetical protein
MGDVAERVSGVSRYRMTAVLVFGTPYLFFWQASEEGDDMHARHANGLLTDHTFSAGKELRCRGDAREPVA